MLRSLMTCLMFFEANYVMMLNQYYNCTNHKEKQALQAKIINNVKQQLKEQKHQCEILVILTSQAIVSSSSGTLGSMMYSHKAVLIL